MEWGFKKKEKEKRGEILFKVKGELIASMVITIFVIKK